MAATLVKVKQMKPDVLVVSGHTKGALTAIRQISEMKVDVPMLAMTHCDAAKLSKQHGKNSQYALCASQWHKTLTYKDKWFKDGMTYDADFTKMFGYAPPYQAAESSAALLVFKDAFERANSFDQKKVRDALAATDMQTFYGNIKFAPHNPNGPIATAASLHVCANVPNFLILETARDMPWHDKVQTNPLEIKNGYFELPNSPGLGTDLDENIIKERPFDVTQDRYVGSWNAEDNSPNDV